MSGDKKRLLCDTVLAMVGEGSDPDDIKISEVAERAGIGKGTVYEYFKSKQELVRETHLYAIRQILRAMCESIDGCEGFMDKIHALLWEMNRQADRNIAMLQRLMEARHQSGTSHECIKKALLPMFYELRVVFSDLIAQGVREKVIRSGHTVLETESAALCMMMTLLVYKKEPSEYRGYTIDQVIDLSCRNFIKLLA